MGAVHGGKGEPAPRNSVSERFGWVNGCLATVAVEVMACMVAMRFVCAAGERLCCLSFIGYFRFELSGERWYICTYRFPELFHILNVLFSPCIVPLAFPSATSQALSVGVCTASGPRGTVTRCQDEGEVECRQVFPGKKDQLYALVWVQNCLYLCVLE